MLISMINFYIYTLKKIWHSKKLGMKKIYLSAFLACVMGGAAQAQIGEGGLPWSITHKSEIEASGSSVRSLTLERPAFEQYAAEDKADGITGATKPFRVAAPVFADITLQNSGSWFYAKNGDKVWRLQVAVEDAKALHFEYDAFALPAKVRLFVYNESKRQILGAYTSSNNDASGMFAHEMVQGSKVTLELVVPAGVATSDIRFHLSKVWAYYRGVDYMNYYASAEEGTAARPTDAGHSSSCNVNAICPQGQNYHPSKNAVAKMTINGGWCSGTLVNNTAGDCKLYFLTASHCDGSNSFSDATFTTVLFTFNFETPDCNGTTGPAGNTVIGANFRARSFYPSFSGGPTGSSRMVGDFLLLELKSTPLAAWNVNFAGWNLDTDLPSLVSDPVKRYIGFHHPSGDFKKLCYGKAVDPTGTFNQNTIPGTHWYIAYPDADGGGMEGGSSGSGLFDGEGRLIGDLSGGSNPAVGSCENAFGEQMTKAGLYSKFSYNWENNFDNNQADYGAKYRLKDWLDPGNTQAFTTDVRSIPCTSVGIIDQELLESAVTVFPSPSTGIVHAKVNFAKPTDLKIDIYNVVGARQQQYRLDKITSGQYTFDLSTLPSGIYIFNINEGGTTISKKVVLTK